MADIDLAFKGEDPGAVRYGNFINYYQFHKPDERVSKVQKEMFHVPQSNDSTFLCLDVGCNSGELTRAMYEYIQSQFQHTRIVILGIDIDPTLIERANCITQANLTFRHMDIMKVDAVDTLRKYLKKYNKDQFDMTFCFSVTMWIHLNHGDVGLKHFINLLQELSNAIIVEPQPWKCYKTAERRMKRSKSNASFPLMNTLIMRENVDIEIESAFTESKQFVKKIESMPSNWKRKMLCFHRIGLKH